MASPQSLSTLHSYYTLGGTCSANLNLNTNTIKFSRLSYIQIFTYLVGIYRVNMMKASLRHIPAEIARNGASPDTWRTIISAPSEPLRQLLDLEKDYGMGAIFDSTDNPDHPFELVGDYGATSTATVQIPSRE